MTEKPAAEFPRVLRQLRAEAGLTQEELAESAGLSPRTVSDLERGIHATARQDTAMLLAVALKLSGPARASFLAAARGKIPATTADADAPARPTAVPQELPADVSAFTGRSGELAELDWLLPAPAPPAAGGAPGPVVISAVAGTAGVGKTALAVHWAHGVRHLFPDGQLYVNLRGYDPEQPVTAGEALAGFLRALGVPGQDIPVAEAERAARYRSAVAGRRLLVVLDNAATVEQVRPLLPGSPSVVVLVTSRDALAGLVARDGARRLDLDLLPADDAVALLHELIGFRADADRAATQALADLCARLPLALRVAAELAVARPGTPLAELVAELAGEEDRLEMLQAGGDPRGAVTSVFSWSYRHLPADAARMFRLLGLHPGPDWDRYSAAALAGCGVSRAGRLLDMLARAHLVQAAGGLRAPGAAGGPGRYGMHDLLRAYAAGLAARHDSEQARREALTSLFDYYLAASATAMDRLAPAERHHRPDPPPGEIATPAMGDGAAARAWLDAELATLTAVAAHTARHGWPGHTVRLAGTLHRYLHGGHDAEGLSICTVALDAARDRGDRAAQAGMLASLGLFHSRQGHYEQAIDCHQQALALARDAGDKLTQARALGNLALLHDGQGNYELSARYHSRALAVYRELGEASGEAVSLSNLGLVYLRQGRYEQAAGRMRQAIDLYRELGHQFGEAIALTNFGDVCYRQGNYTEAAGFQEQALALASEIGDRRVAAWALTRLGQVRCRQGMLDQSAASHQQALDVFQEIGDREGEADALNGAGETLLAAGQPEQASARHFAALSLAGQTGNKRERARALTRLGEICRQQGRLEEAASYHQQALELYREIGDSGGEADALNGASETLLAAGRAKQADPTGSGKPA